MFLSNPAQSTNQRQDTTNHEYKFQGFTAPQYTQVPDQLFDELLPILSGNEIKVLLYICRRTFGFHKTNDNISLNQMLFGITKKDGTQLDKGLGISKPTLLRTLKSLKHKNIIIAQKRRSIRNGNEPTNYRLNIAPLGSNFDQGESQNFTNPVGSKVDQEQQTEEQKTEIQQLVVALTDLGIALGLAKKWCSAFNPKYIQQKIDYLQYIIEKKPKAISNPRGWLRKAIEENYGVPDGYKPKAVRIKEHEEELREQQQVAQAISKAQRATQERLEQEHQKNNDILTQLQRQYGTTSNEMTLWQHVCSELEQVISPSVYAFVKKCRLLKVEDGIAVIATTNSFGANQINKSKYRQMVKIFKKAGQKVTKIKVIVPDK